MGENKILYFQKVIPPGTRGTNYLLAHITPHNITSDHLIKSNRRKTCTFIHSYILLLSNHIKKSSSEIIVCDLNIKAYLNF